MPVMRFYVAPKPSHFLHDFSRRIVCGIKKVALARLFHKSLHRKRIDNL
jgi:hypothetical protein